MKNRSRIIYLSIGFLIGGIALYFLYVNPFNKCSSWLFLSSNKCSSGEITLAPKESKLPALYTFSGTFTGTISLPGLTLSGGSLYGDPSKIKIDDRWVLSVILPDPGVPDSYTKILALDNSFPESEFRFKRVAWALDNPSLEDLAKLNPQDRDRYTILRALFASEPPSDSLSIVTRECFENIFESNQISGDASESLKEICQAKVPKDLIFSSYLDPNYTRYTYHLFAQAYSTQNKNVCLGLLNTQLKDTAPLERAKDHMRSLMLCEGIAMRNPKIVFNRIYSIQVLIGKKRCDPYRSFPEVQKLCEEVLTMLPKK
jgi:hypothetical protein